MPAKSRKQQRAAGIELRRRREGKSRQSFKSLSTEKLRHYARSRRNARRKERRGRKMSKR